MISERQVAAGFRSLWSDVLPLLTPGFVHLFNEAYCEKMSDKGGEPLPEVPSGKETDPTLVSEFAFHLVRIAHQRQVDMAGLAKNDVLIAEAEAQALTLIREYEGAIAERVQALSVEERREGLLLVERYMLFVSSLGDEAIEFSPSLRGVGFVDACAGDVSIGASLFEVKTVTRNIGGRDIRQLLVYLALQAATGQRRWSEGGFFNPRRARVYRFSVDRMLPLISGGRLATEVFDEMVNYFCSRDIELDSMF